MFSREATRLSAWAALIAVLFVVLLPATLSAAGKSGTSSFSLHGPSSICTLDGVKTSSTVPDQQPVVTTHSPCVFCTSSVPVFADANTPRVVALIEGVPVVVGLPNGTESLPPDVAATQPLSPRAPPRLN
jgi:hypothetical protein